MALHTAEELGFKASVMLCDSVVGSEGKLFILGGGWDNLNLPTYPSRVARLGLALMISVPYGETNKSHKLKITIRGEDGQPIVLGNAPSNPQDPASVPRPITAIDGEFTAGRPPTLQSGDAQTMAMAINIDQFLIPAPGAYSVMVELDDKEIGRAKFRAHAPAGFIRKR